MSNNELLEKVISTTSVGAGAGGLLNPDQANRFIDYMWDATTLANEGRVIRMRSNTVDLDKVSVGQRITRLATEAVDDGVNTEATFTKVSLTTKKLRLDWELSATQFGNDVEDLAINGDSTSADPLLKAFDGFRSLVLNQASSSHVIDAAGAFLGGTGVNDGKQILNKAIKAMPRKYMQRRNDLRFYTGVNLQQDYIFDQCLSRPR